MKKRREKLPDWLDRVLLLLTAMLLVAIGTVLGHYGFTFPSRSRSHLGHTHYRFISENPFLVWAGRLAILALFAYAITFFISHRWLKREQPENTWNEG